MKTFEERYTAWIDGQLAGPALAAFDQELVRRSAAGEVEADRTDAMRLRHLLRAHLEAPVLNNADFFSHQLRERIDAERAATGGRAGSPANRGGFRAIFPWSVARLAGLGAACLFVAAALYYGLEPGTNSGVNGKVVSVSPAAVVEPAASDVPSAGSAPAKDRDGAVEYAMISPTPAPLDSPDIQIRDTPGASATALRYQQPNVNVLWTNGLPYLADLPGSPAPSATPSGSVVVP